MIRMTITDHSLKMLQGTTWLRTVVRQIGPVVPFALPLLLYLLTLAPTIYNLDSAELTTAVVTNGIIRATGYPLYLLLGKIATWLPVGDMGYRLNLFSAICGAITIGLADRILSRLQVGRWARWGALGLLATAPYFWAMSLIAEVYTLHTALMAGIILLFIRWLERPTPARLAPAVFLLSLSMGNHLATLLLVPGAVYLVLAGQPHVLRQGRTWLLGGAAVLLGASVYLLLPWRYAMAPAFNYAGEYDSAGIFQPVNLQSLSGLWWLVSGQSFAGQMFAYHPAELLTETRLFGNELWGSFLAVGIGPGLLGSFLAWRQDRRVGGMLVLMFLANAIFYINYRVIDKATMYLPTYLIWAVWLGVGYQALITWAGEVSRRKRLPWLLRIIMLGAVVLALNMNWTRVDLSDDWSTREQSEEILRLVEPDALILGWWDTVPAIQYLQLVEGQRPDVMAINRFLIGGWEMKQLILSELGKRPIYMKNPPVELLSEADAVPVGPLYRLQPRPGSERSSAEGRPERSYISGK